MSLKDKFKKLADKSNSNSFDTSLRTVLDRIESRANNGKYSLFWIGYLDQDIQNYLTKEGFIVSNFTNENPRETGVLIKWI